MTEDPAFDGVNWYSYCGGNPVMYWDPSGLKETEKVNYIIYSDDTSSDEGVRPREQAEKIKKNSEDKFTGEFIIKEVKSASEFVDTWNSMPDDKDIGEVIVICHGTITREKGASDFGVGALGFKDGSRLFADGTTSVGENDENMSSLESKKMDFLYFSACNTANPDAKINIVDAFFNKNSEINTVGGWDGGVAYVPKVSGLGWLLGYRDKPIPDEGNHTVIALAEIAGHPGRKAQGYVEVTRITN